MFGFTISKDPVSNTKIAILRGKNMSEEEMRTFTNTWFSLEPEPKPFPLTENPNCISNNDFIWVFEFPSLLVMEHPS